MYDVFARGTTLFRALAAAPQAGEEAQLVLHRFEGPQGASALHVADLNEGTADRYHVGGYGAAYLTFSSLPTSESDWAFLDREAPFLIELTGGRTRGDRMEIARIRKVAKSSKVAGALRRITTQLDAQCTRGVLLSGHPYPNIRVERGLFEAMTLWWSLDDDGMQATPLPSSAG